MEEFSFYLPTRIFFGTGAIKVISDVIHSYGKRAFFVITKAIKRSRKLETILSIVDGHTEFTIYEDISPNPKVHEINKASILAKIFKPDVLVGIGGGSVIDAAKALSVIVPTEDRIEDYLLNGHEVKKKTLPLIAVPTTCGTGAEVSRGAIITDSKRKVKGGIRGDYVFPSVAIVDPQLTLSLPSKITGETGFDILCHAIETYVSRRASALTDIFAQQALTIVRDSLIKAYDNGNDIESKTSLMFASLLMGFNLANSSTCLPHRLQYPVGAVTDTSHSCGLAPLMPVWIHNVHQFSSEKFAIIAGLLGYPERADKAETAVRALIHRLGMKSRLRDLGIKREEIGSLVDGVNGNLKNDPGSVTKESIAKIYESAW
jgi:alcohol dehydrogenase class IV